MAAELGAEPSLVVEAHADRSEDAARRARYAGLEKAAADTGASRVLLGHTRDDQAESVLLALARGSGPRSLSGMRLRRGVFLRPFLDLPRATVRSAAEHTGLAVWDDPANLDRSFARTRVRYDALPAVEQALGPGVAESLARTAALFAADSDALDGWAESVDPGGTEAEVTALVALPAAVRTRVVRALMLRAGVSAGAVTAAHITAVDALLTRWHGQGPVMLPDRRVALRTCGRLRIEPSEPS